MMRARHRRHAEFGDDANERDADRRRAAALLRYLWSFNDLVKRGDFKKAYFLPPPCCRA